MMGANLVAEKPFREEQTTGMGIPSLEFQDCIEFLNAILHRWAQEQRSMSTGSSFDTELEEVVSAVSTCIAQASKSGGIISATWPDIVREDHFNRLGNQGAFHIWMAFGAREMVEITRPLVESIWSGSPRMPDAYETFKKVSEFLCALFLEVNRQEEAVLES